MSAELCHYKLCLTAYENFVLPTFRISFNKQTTKAVRIV